MSIRSFEVWDYVIFAICMCISASIGVYHAFAHGGQKTTEEYYYGNRQMGSLPLALSLLVTYQSSIFLLGYPGEMYIYGSMFWLSFIGVGIGFLLIAWLIVPLLHPLEIRSAFQYLERRYNHSAPRKVASFLSVILYAIFMGLVVYGPAITLDTVTKFPLWASMVIVAAAGIFYTTVGGFKAVIWADVFQSIIIVIGLLSLLIKGILSVSGGLQEVWEVCESRDRIQFDEVSADITVRHTVWGMVFGKAVEFFSLGFTQLIVQRILSTKTTAQAQRAVYMAIPGFAVYGSVACLLGLIVFAFNTINGCDPLAKKIIRSPNQILPYYVMDIFHDLPGMPGVFLAALFSASLSTLSSGLNSLPTITWEDFMKPCFPKVSEWKATLIGKVLVVVYGGVAIGVAYLVVLVGGPIVQVTSTISSCIGGPVCGMFVLGATFKSANFKGAIAGCLTSVTFLLWIALGAVLNFKYPRLPGSVTDKCPGSSPQVFNMTEFNISTTYPQTTVGFNISSTSEAILQDAATPSVLWVYKISYIWYTFIGIVLSVLIGMIVSLLTGGMKTADSVDSRYLFRFRRLCEPEPEMEKKPSKPPSYRESQARPDPNHFLPEMKEALFERGDNYNGFNTKL